MTTDIKLFDFGIGRDVRRCESVARLVKTIKLVIFPCFDKRFVLSGGLGCIFWIIFGNEIFNVIRSEDDYNLHKNFYDAEGLRNRIEENGKVTDFVYSGNILLSEKEVNSTRECRYILGNEYLGHETVREEPSDTNACQKQAYSYITDEQGSLRYIMPTGRQKPIRNTVRLAREYGRKERPAALDITARWGTN